MGVPQQILTVTSPQVIPAPQIVNQHLQAHMQVDSPARARSQASATAEPLELEPASAKFVPACQPSVVQGQASVHFVNNTQIFPQNLLNSSALQTVPQGIASIQQTQQALHQVSSTQKPQQLPQQVASTQPFAQPVASVQQPQQVPQPAMSTQQVSQQFPQQVTSAQQFSSQVASTQQVGSMQQVPQQVVSMKQPQQVLQQVAAIPQLQHVPQQQMPQQMASVKQFQQAQAMQQCPQVPQQTGSIQQSSQIPHQVSSFQQPQQVVSVHQIAAMPQQMAPMQQYPGMLLDTSVQPPLAQQEQKPIQMHQSTDQHPCVMQQMLYQLPLQQQKQEQFAFPVSSTEQLPGASQQDMEQQAELSGSTPEQMAYPMQTQYQLQAQEQLMYPTQSPCHLQASEKQTLQPANQQQAPEHVVHQMHAAQGPEQPPGSEQLMYVVPGTYPGQPLDQSTYPMQSFYQGQTAYITQPPPHLVQPPEAQQTHLTIQVTDQPSFAMHSPEQPAYIMQDGGTACTEQICLAQSLEIHSYSSEQHLPEPSTYLIQQDSGIGHQPLQPPYMVHRIAEGQQPGLQAPFVPVQPSLTPQMQPQLPYQEFSQHPFPQLQASGSAQPLKTTISQSVPNPLQTVSSVPEQPEQADTNQLASELLGLLKSSSLLQALQPSDNNSLPVQPTYSQQQPVGQIPELSAELVAQEVPSESSVTAPLNQQPSVSAVTHPQHVQEQDIPQV